MYYLLCVTRAPHIVIYIIFVAESQNQKIAELIEANQRKFVALLNAILIVHFYPF